MNKPVFGMLLGGFLGVFDGLSALVSAPETAPQIVGIVIGSTIKGVITGLLVGLFTRKTGSLPLALVFGLAVGCFLAFLITIGSPYSWQIMLPGSILGLIVGYATFRHGGTPQTAGAR
jgi:hypothetical protein